MSFTKALRAKYDSIFEANYNHPFIRGVAAGQLKPDQLIHYVKQDFEYLSAYARVYGLALAKCTNREDMAMFNEKIDFVLNSETHPHQCFCEQAGVAYEELQGYPVAPAAHHYIRHMLTVAHEGTLGEIMCVLLPCPWIYLDIGQRLMEEVNPKDDHPFAEWIRFYGSERLAASNQEFCDRIDKWAAEEAKADELLRMEEHFMISAQMEYLFWDMAYTIQDWPVPVSRAKQPITAGQ